VTDDSSREFAVLVPLLDHEGEECVLLTKRLETLPKYSGQVAFPGGAREPQDENLEETALRETEEEVGIPPQAVRILRELAWQETALAHRVKPFVGKVEGPYTLRPEPREVERLLYLPSARLNPELFSIRGTFVDSNQQSRNIYTFSLDGCEVWGLTARILRELAGGGDQ
jgi:8-oxo-dGTP pyrophosphatase MutT (NUDIX family)